MKPELTTIPTMMGRNMAAPEKELKEGLLELLRGLLNDAATTLAQRMRVNTFISEVEADLAQVEYNV
jgi:hypothetical protein